MSSEARISTSGQFFVTTKHIPVVPGDQEVVIHFAVTALLRLEQQCAVAEGCQLREAEVKSPSQDSRTAN